jgi:hypothetical protein
MYYYDNYGWLTQTVLAGRDTDITPPQETATLKANWNGFDWVLREYVAPPPPPEPTPEPRHISVGAFFDRFGAQKYPILASSDPIVQALIKDCTVRKYIDLDRADLPMGLQMIVSAGFAIAPEAVLAAPILDNERP